MRPHHRTALIDDVARPRAECPLKEALCVPIGNKADVIGVGLVAHTQSAHGSLGSHLCLRTHLPQRKHCARELLRSHDGKHIRLVLVRINRPVEFACPILPDHDPRVVASGNSVEAKRLSTLQQRVKLDVLVAAHARIRRASGLVLSNEIGHDEVMEFVGEVPHVVRDAQLVRSTASIVRILNRATTTRTCAVLIAVAAERHMDAHDVVTRFHRARGSHGGVNSSR